MAVDENTLGIVWAESARLTPVDGADATKARLQAVIAGLVTRARGLGSLANFARPAPLPGIAPAPGGQQAEAMRQAVENALASGQFNGVKLPLRAVLWEITATGDPSESERALPRWAAWIKQGLASRTSDFKVEGDTTGRIFRLYESDAEPGLDDVSFVSGFTGSGLPRPLRQTSYFSGPWIVGGLATVLFLWMVITLGWTGRTVIQARDLMAGNPPEYAGAVANSLMQACTQPPPGAPAPAGAAPSTEFIPSCTGEGAPDPGKRTQAGVLGAMKACLAGPKDAPLLRTSSFCRLAWRAVAQKANTSEMTNLPSPFGSFFVAVSGWSAKVTGPTASISITLPMIGLMLAIALLGGALGYGTKGRVFGIWTSPQNRMSLARMQVSLWTIVVLGGYTALALFNIGQLGELIRDFNVQNPDGSAAPQAFPTIPIMILAALGISVASPMISSLIKGNSGATSVDLQDTAQARDKSGIGRFIDPKADGNLEVRSSPAQASLVDFFTGETEKDKDMIDVARLQNVVVTVMLVCGYATMLFDFARDIPPDVVVRALEAKSAVFPSLPDPGGTFTTLLTASHATYLVAKQASVRS